MIARLGSQYLFLVNFANFDIISKLMQISSQNLALFPANKPTSECVYEEKPKYFKMKMAKILKKEGINEEIPDKIATSSKTIKKKEERKEATFEESQGEEDLQLNQNTDHYQIGT